MDGSISLYNIVISYIGAAVLAQEWGDGGRTARKDEEWWAAI